MNFGMLLVHFLGIATESPADIAIRPGNLLAKKPIPLPLAKFADITKDLPPGQIFLRLGPAARKDKNAGVDFYEWDVADGSVFQVYTQDLRGSTLLCCFVDPSAQTRWTPETLDE